MEQNSQHELEVGSQLELTLTDSDRGEVVLKELYEVVKVPEKGIVRGTVDESQYETRLLSQQWSDPELKALNEESEANVPTTRGGNEAIDAGKLAVDAVKLGLDVAKFAWDIVKNNKPVVDVDSTTTYVLYKDTGSLDYKDARSASPSSYTLSVRDSLIKSWEVIHADIVCEGTYNATPRNESIPLGHYLPDVHLYAPNAHADFPCQLNAKAQLSNVSNMGRSAIDPMVTILSSLDFGWLFQRKHMTVKFEASGSQGIYRTG
ncbi:MAG: hypothetical protein P8171_16530 [Candidatus Thiodiazotropha sp.]